MVTIYDIAKKANVSPMTVSRVINNSPSIKESTRLKVEQVIRELEYVPNKQARSLTSKETRLVSLVIPDISNPFFTNIARGAEDKALQLGYQLILGNTDENQDKEEKYVKMLMSTGVDGVLIAPTGDGSAANLKKLTKRRIPFVYVDRTVPAVPADSVTGDNPATIKGLVQHLTALGHTRIAMINGPGSISIAREREQAFEEALKLSGLTPQPMYTLGTHFKKDSLSEIVSGLQAIPKQAFPTAILAANNFIGVNTLRALHELQLRVPEDVAVACFDDPDIIPDYNPFLTVASQPAYDMGFLGMQLLIERIQGTAPIATRRIVLPAEIIVRRSTVRE
ncbi:LacI family DNA-binding transcriptional regulator [Paenibacillus mucilaginosus]|uniref:Catabolite control protein A n=3 Tax=Paenibacillus mucilaginosus TaxID=61624 RepID=H6NI51_9BACL|nr:LacI family DNA-binding transcriptional regulator [Paenibacillus mucilaginosus]AEI43157.1 transcriptional regulator, LacI family [Paenibacillus mucilaginosus KNP414]AFC30822.1 LacI family transcriptional regulator [Paenibacillus mucilaginosus 3016]AFH63144.1 LacI family transcriptional regulator [Paenibacillus mucilaginosus K02]MCG7212278.1 LacI family transcriptional regulator [Paenibacillus mucilaginosus]WDM24761.1 LacI family DNA-binding transcriptional regulator [Paenibacillus mucilagin